jgi:hypothetical protein
MSLQQYNQYPALSQVRLAASSNQSGTYFNGPLNNGVGATFTYATGALTIDSVTVNVGDRILFQGQTNANENGIYICTTAGATGIAAVLQRAADMQCIEQVRAGMYASVGAGSVNAGNFYTIVEPVPAIFGVSNFNWNADPSAGGVSFSGAASTANAIPVFSDTAGNIKAATTTATLAHSLSVTGTVTGSTGLVATTGNIVASAGNLQGLSLLYGATPVAQVDPGSCTITAAAGASNTATVTVQLKDGAGNNITYSSPFRVYASSASNGLTLASAASTGFSVASGGLSLANGTAVTTQISAMSSATGGCVLSLLDTAKQTSYLVLVLHNGVKISAQLSSGSYGA